MHVYSDIHYLFNLYMTGLLRVFAARIARVQDRAEYGASPARCCSLGCAQSWLRTIACAESLLRAMTHIFEGLRQWLQPTRRAPNK